MALEVLAGPYSILIDGVAPDTVANVGGEGITWIQGLGLYIASCAPHGEGSKVIAVQMDGTGHRRGPFPLSNLGTIVTDLRAGGRGYAGRDAFSLFPLNYLAANHDATAFFSTSPTILGDIRVVCADRFLKLVGAAVQWSALDDSVTWATEYTFASFGTGGNPTISRGRGANELCITWGTSGQIRFYDTIAKAQAGATLFVGETNDAVVYVPKWDVFVELKSKQIKVLANAPRPASISTPAFSPAATAGEVSAVSVQVLGAQSEPCVGELVDWSIVSGGGSLSATQSMTDATGHATVNYIAPIGLSGSVHIEADLAF